MAKAADLRIFLRDIARWEQATGLTLAVHVPVAKSEGPGAPSAWFENLTAIGATRQSPPAVTNDRAIKKSIAKTPDPVHYSCASLQANFVILKDREKPHE